MKKYILVLCTFLGYTSVFSQVGINTNTPQGIFNIDGGKDNANPPTATQQLNDLVVLPNGNMGLGTTTPTTKLDIVTGGTSALPVTGFKLFDGTQGTNKYLRSDANGVGTWQEINITRKVQLGKFPSSQTTVLSDGGATPKYSTTYLTLGPGKWVVHVGLTIYENSSGLANGENYPISLYLSSNQTVLENTTFNFIGSNRLRGRMIRNTWSGSPVLIQGVNVIDVTDPAGTTIYVMIENKSASTEQWRFVTTNWENYLHAFPVN